MKKVLIFTSLIICTILFLNSTRNPETQIKKETPVSYRSVFTEREIIGSEPAPNDISSPVIWDSPAKTEFVYDSPENITITTAEVNVNARTTYDFQSMGAIRYLLQDPANSQYLHAIFMVDPIGASGFPDRRTKYYLSTNMGAEWTFVGNVTEIRSGFPSIDLLSDRRAIVALHSIEGVIRKQLHKYMLVLHPVVAPSPGLAPGHGSLF